MSAPLADDPTPRVLATLTPPQYEAVMAPESVLCVLAGAGAGKTRVLTLRVARRIEDGTADEDRILVATFSRKAADELRRRLWLLGLRGDLWAGTFHRTALSLIRQHRSERGAAAPIIVADRRAMLAALVEEAAATGSVTRSGGPRAAAGRLDGEIGWAKARLLAPGDYEEAAAEAGRRAPMAPGLVAQLYQRYEEAKRRRRALDLDDLLWTAADVLEDDQQFAAAVRWRFRHLFVDEMQDVNPAQFRLLRALLGPEPDLFVVGDPNQSVYGWNGADPGLLDRLPAMFEGTKVVRLDENHRSSPQVVTLAAAALGMDTEANPVSNRPEGPLPNISEHQTDQDEASWIARQVYLAHHPGWRWSHIAVLARTNAQLRILGEALEDARIPHRLASGDLAPASDLRRDPITGALVPVDEAEEAAAEVGGEALGPGDDAVVLSTFHRAKGLQWPAVFVVGLSEGLVPIASARNAAAQDEERRLLYVALTRAEDELSCSWSHYPHPAAAAAGGTGRRPSRWLESLVVARATLEAEARTGDVDSVSTHLAELRAQLAGPAGAGGTDAALS